MRGEYLWEIPSFMKTFWGGERERKAFSAGPGQFQSRFRAVSEWLSVFYWSGGRAFLIGSERFRSNFEWVHTNTHVFRWAGCSSRAIQGQRKRFQLIRSNIRNIWWNKTKKKEHRGNLESRTLATGPEQFQGILPNRYPLVVWGK